MTRVAGNGFGATGGEHVGLALRWAANVVTTSAWCSLDTCVAGNEESHTLHPFKAKRVCDLELPSCKGTLNHNFRPHRRSAKETQSTLPSVSLTTLHVHYIIIFTIILLLRFHTKASPIHSNPNGLLHYRITPAVPRTTPPFVNLPVPWRRGKKYKPPW